MAWGKCRTCDRAFENYHDFAVHEPCGTFAGQDITIRTRRSYAQWDDATAVEVHVNPATGEVRYPGQHNARLKEGYERQYLRSLHEVERFEQAHNVRSEMAWYDKGSGRGFDDEHHGRKLVH